MILEAANRFLLEDEWCVRINEANDLQSASTIFQFHEEDAV
jgi:hypothetical protein